MLQGASARKSVARSRVYSVVAAVLCQRGVRGKTPVAMHSTTCTHAQGIMIGANLSGQGNGDGTNIGVPIGKIMGWDPSLQQKEHEILVQKSIYSYKSIP